MVFINIYYAYRFIEWNASNLKRLLHLWTSFDSQRANNFYCTCPIEMTYRHHVTLDGHFVALDLMDTAGKVSSTVLFMLITNRLRGVSNLGERQTSEWNTRTLIIKSLIFKFLEREHFRWLLTVRIRRIKMNVPFSIDKRCAKPPLYENQLPSPSTLT